MFRYNTIHLSLHTYCQHDTWTIHFMDDSFQHQPHKKAMYNFFVKATKRVQTWWRIVYLSRNSSDLVEAPLWRIDPWLALALNKSAKFKASAIKITTNECGFSRWEIKYFFLRNSKITQLLIHESCQQIYQLNEYMCIFSWIVKFMRIKSKIRTHQIRKPNEVTGLSLHCSLS